MEAVLNNTEQKKNNKKKHRTKKKKKKRKKKKKKKRARAFEKELENLTHRRFCMMVLTFEGREG